MAEIEEAIGEQMMQREAMLTFIRNYKKDGASRRNKFYYQKRLDDFDKHWNKFEEGHKQVLRIAQRLKFDKKDELEYFDKDIYAEMEDYFIINYSAIRERFEVEFPTTTPRESSFENSSNTTVLDHEVRTGVKLPKITLEKFGGSYDRWPTFHDLFRTMIDQNPDLSAVQKLQYLKLHLTGEPEHLLRHYQVTERNYESAWKLLKDRYDNKRVLVNAQLKILLGQPAINNESAQAIMKLMDTTSETLQALHNLEVNVENWDPIIVYLLVQKLPRESHQLWEQEAGKSKELPTWECLKQFLEIRFRTLEAMYTKTSISRPNMNVKSSGVFHTTSAGDVSCVMCKAGHLLRKCPKFLSMSPDGRLNFIKTKQVCFNCLCSGHRVPNCLSNGRCFECQKPHHTLLHLKSASSLISNINVGQSSSNASNSVDVVGRSAGANLSVDGPSFSVAAAVPSTSNNSNSGGSGAVNSFFVNKVANQVLLATVLVEVIGPSGKGSVVRALVDRGSQASFLTQRIVQSLNLNRESVSAKIQGLGDGSDIHINRRSTFKIKSLVSEREIELEGYIMKKLTQVLPSTTISNCDWDHIRDLKLADPKFYLPGTIDLLLGADVFHKIILQGLIKGKEGTPMAQKTIFGWMLSGSIKISNEQHAVVSNFHLTSSLENQLRTFWEVEEVKCENLYTEEEKICEEIYEKTTKRRANGQYEVELPFIEIKNENVLGKSRDIAIHRLFQLENRFKKDVKFKEDYTKCINEYLSLGHMIKVNCKELWSENSYKSCYLPHHGVVKETSTTTKLRVVFDASRTTKSGKSLNNLMLKGPTVQNELFQILLRWRKHKVAFTADVEKMYRQIWVKEPFTEYQRIVWREDKTQPISDYKLLTVTFGTKSAPYLATRTLKQLAMDESKNYPTASKIAMKDFYVDDLLSGADTIPEALELQRQLLQLTESGGFPLRKWMSNKKELCYALTDEKNDIQLPNLLEKEETIRTLGISWNAKTDMCTYKVNLYEKEVNWTKRTVLSQIARLFDPLGLLAPIIILAKIMMQKLWLCGLAWDDKLVADLKNEWCKYYENLLDIEKIQVPRWINYTKTSKKIEIHGFADASERAYAAVVYLCIQNENNSRKSNILMAKTKVAPIKTISLPRLELCAAHLLSKLIVYVIEALQMEPEFEIFAWTDSQIVLAWLRDHPNRWTTFVANRVSHIHELLGRNVWNHVSTKENPADCASRGIFPSQLNESELWWQGPGWLQQDKIYWPTQAKLTETGLERRRIVLGTVNINNDNYENKYSSLTKLIRVLSYCIRFISNLKSGSHQKISGYLSNLEMQNTTLLLIRRAQQRHYQHELKLLRDGLLINGGSILKLNPFLDPDGILRVGGRLRNSELSYDQKFPIILPEKDVFTNLLLRKTHIETLHAGFQLMMSVLRNKYWIVNARSNIRALIHNCIRCYRQKATPANQLMGDLPRSRVKISRPFSHSGLDYCGPFQLKTHKGRGAKKYKAYIALFICMTTRAIHLELVTDMSAEGFIAAFRRFCSRRGLCQNLYCDNGTNFVGANKIISKQYNQMLKDYESEVAELIENQGVNFHFIPPVSPHFGGLWEAGVKSTKFHLTRVLGNNILTYEEFSTVLCQIEACLNSRPICDITNDVNELAPLTPAHFLVGGNMLAAPQPSLLDTNINRLDRWQHLQHITQSFWKRWQTEYLSRLQQRPKWAKQSGNVKVGDMIILKEDNLPPCKWSLGRVTKIHPGADGLVRVVTIKTAVSEFKRPITKISILPINREDNLVTTLNASLLHGREKSGINL